MSILLAVQYGSADPINQFERDGGESKSRFISISGEVGTYGELYSISGRDRRRPPATGRLFLRPTISILNTFDINLNLFLSSEGSGARQDINRIDINPKWGWGEAHLVDFTDSYSQFTLNGIKIRGVGVNLTPGRFRASFISGITQRSVS